MWLNRHCYWLRSWACLGRSWGFLGRFWAPAKRGTCKQLAKNMILKHWGGPKTFGTGRSKLCWGPTKFGTCRSKLWWVPTKFGTWRSKQCRGPTKFGTGRSKLCWPNCWAKILGRSFWPEPANTLQNDLKSAQIIPNSIRIFRPIRCP